MIGGPFEQRFEICIPARDCEDVPVRSANEFHRIDCELYVNVTARDNHFIAMRFGGFDQPWCGVFVQIDAGQRNMPRVGCTLTNRIEIDIKLASKDIRSIDEPSYPEVACAQP